MSVRELKQIGSPRSPRLIRAGSMTARGEHLVRYFCEVEAINDQGAERST